MISKTACALRRYSTFLVGFDREMDLNRAYNVVVPVPLEFLRIFLGLLALFFGYFLGRVAMRQRRQNRPQTRTITWVLRTVVCLAGVLWGRGLDLTSVVFLALTALSIALGAYVESHPRQPEEIHLFRDR